ncbi:MAG: nucleotidyltransferase [Balneolaceae bacterium]|nr:MAG: nucleotidyltransferase [Balneolaceae bacterium]
MPDLSILKKKLRELKPLLARKFFVEQIGYFGSYAYQSESEESDIDILVDLKKPLGWGFIELKMFLEKELNRPVDLVTRNALKKQLREQILSETRFI